MENKFKIFLEVATDDLDSSRLLYRKKKFPHAVFFFEQSVEKACKYLLLREGALSPEELRREISHNSIVVFKLYSQYIIESVSSIFDTGEAPKDNTNPNLFTPHELVEELKLAQKTFDDMSKERFNELDQVSLEHKLLMLRNISRDFPDHTRYSSFFNSDPKTLLNFFPQFIKLTNPERQAFEENLKNEKFKEELINNIKDSMARTKEKARIDQTLMVLAQIFSCHSNRTRYPDNELESSPCTLYNESNILVKNLQSFYPYQEDVLAYLNRISISKK